MRKKRYLFLMPFLTLTVLFASAQSSCFIDGFIEDSLTGERLPGGSISTAVGNKVVTTSSNSFGYFSLPVRCEPSFVVIVTYMGYQLRQINIDTSGKTSLVIKLIPRMTTESEVVVNSSENRIATENLGQLKLSRSIIKRMPEFLGDNDPLKVMQTLPGVSQGMEGTSGLIVRGGSPDQNLFLLDGTPVYNPTHLGGLFSPFNGDAIKDVTLYKSNFPARFGERLSSVVDISTRDGNMKKLAGEGSVGMLATKVMFEGPIKKDKSSFMISARRSYWDVLAAPFLALTNTEEEKRKANVYFYDINAKFNYILSPKDRIYASFFTSNDIYRLKVNSTYNNGANDENIARLAWSNVAGSLRWNHIFSPGFFSNTTFYATSYKMSTDYYYRESEKDVTTIQEGNYTSDIKDVGLKTDLEYKAGTAHLLRLGLQSSYKYFLPGSSSKRSVTEDATEQITTIANNRQGSPELAVYAEDELQISEKLNANLGLRASIFKAPSKWYHSLDPRVSVNYVLNEGLRVSASYAQMRQYIHLLANNSVSLPTDIWVPATNDIKPMLSRQVSVGVNNSFGKAGLELGVEAYYKTLNGIVEYLDGQSYLSSSSQNWEQVVEAGRGSAYGVEFFLQKKKGSSTGWISYSYSKSMREFPTINSGEPFPFKYDRRHLLNLVYMVPINHRWKFSANWTFQSGAPFTLPTSTFKTISQVNPTQPDISYHNSSAEYIRGRNEFRLLDYHRLDLGFKWSKKKKSFEKYWNFSFYNVYNRKNPMIYFFEDDYWSRGTQLKGSGFFPIIPSISYGFKF